ncbi:hypothetical protein BJV78DRAFT_1237287 [Lactifluus subvellereus]|nr:hypothetical protein BJV78DRAFT_1237287 [Lactifluus subvellereus]
MALVEPHQVNYLLENAFPRLHDCIQQNARIQPAVGEGPLQVHLEDNLLPVENPSIQDQVQHLCYIDRARYDEMDHPLHHKLFNHHAGLVHDVQAQAQVLNPPIPEIQGNGIFAYAPQGVAAGPDGALPDAWPDRVPAPGPPGAEILRCLASYYLHHPDAQVDMVRMEPGPAGRFKVMIMLEMANFL